jgi:hypothetical protein
MFPFRDQENTAVITCSHVINDNQPILHVSHDEDDGMWQFLCGKSHEPAEAMIMSLAEIYQHDNSVAAIADLPLGVTADRADKNSQWSRSRQS